MLLGIISDIHEDLQSLEQALRFFSKNTIGEIICLGDITGSGETDSNKADLCVELVRENCSIVVCGNHDLETVKRIPDHKAGFAYPSNWYELSRTQKERIGGGKLWIHEDEVPALSDINKLFLKKLPEYHVLEKEHIMFSHYAYPDLTGIIAHFIGEQHELEEHFAFMKDHQCRLGFSGHRHPEGCLIATEKEIMEKTFGTHQIEYDAWWIDIPCIARGPTENGFAILDTASMQIEVVPLKKL